MPPALPRLAARALFLHERPALRLAPEQVEAWAKALAEDGDPARLRQYWVWEGIDPAATPAHEAEGVWPSDLPLPTWVNVLAEALSTPPPHPLPPGTFKPEAPVPFEEALAPFLQAFHAAFVKHAGAALERFAPAAVGALTRGLLSRLATVLAQPLYAEWQLNRASGLGALAQFARQPNSLYRHFIQHLLTGGWWEFFEKYPVAARLTGGFIELWAAAQTEFAQRLAADAAEIARFFQWDSATLDQVILARVGLSDAHRGGRGVCAVTIAGGQRLIYKPKDLHTEAAFSGLIEWANARAAPITLKALRVLPRPHYGWVEFADHAPCADEAALERYFERAGALLCLIHLLEGADCHGENVIAAGEFPVLIDGETLFHHRPQAALAAADQATAQFAAFEQLNRSVLHTGFLPMWTIGPNNAQAFDVSALSGYAEQTTPYQQLEWQRVNTDRMTMRPKPVTLPLAQNLPVLQGESHTGHQHRAAVLRGFEQQYRFLVANRSELAAPLAAFAELPVRFVFRATRIYGLLWRQCLQFDALRDGVAYSLPLEQLARAFFKADSGNQPPADWGLFHAERAALALGDIPFFTARTTHAALEISETQALADYFEGPSFDLVSARLSAWGEADLQTQRGLINAALRLRAANDHIPAQTVVPVPTANPVFDPARARAEARAIARQLAEHAIHGADGSVTWVAPQMVTRAEHFQLTHLDLNIYDGLSGVALFLAAVARCLADAEARALSLAIVPTLRRELLTAEPWRPETPIGGATGVGAWVYALTKLGQWLDAPDCLVLAQQVAARLTPAHITRDPHLDIISGAAGGVVSLLALHAATRDPHALRLAELCGQHLLDRRCATTTGLRAWITLDDQPLTGFAHGAAGMAYALLRLSVATADAALRAACHAAAVEAIAYENSLFDTASGQWPDLRPNSAPFMAAWCHGASGIGLGRLGGLPAFDTETIRADLDHAHTATHALLSAQHTHADHLCCGNAGRIEILATLGQRLGRPDWVAQAQAHAAQMIARTQAREGYQATSAQLRGLFVPGLFQGLAGIGYTWLRLAFPTELPCLLLWE
jgi:type 2 lantibiotic biosynthesis protein LanM